METTASPNVITLKLLIDTKGKRVLFGEAGKDFVDFLFSILSMPIGTIIRLFSINDIDMVGTLAKIYQSLENLSETYIQNNVNKDTLLKPNKSSIEDDIVTPLTLANNVSTSYLKHLYSCSREFNHYSSSPCQNNKYVSDDPKAICPDCQNMMNKVLTYVPLKTSSSGAELLGGFVKGVVTYMIMDDLEVKPMSTISCIALLNTFKITEVGALEEKTVSVGIVEGLSLLKASLQTKTVLSHVFLEKGNGVTIN
ncbi:uncharacterized protein LOC133821721 [Humulus lupulus]|uniref:uncharacterized protein LOC133821721 n=1 Tax=Humulus lupulus TaxID=3486 RepID=UPI002B40CD37|nr:uncharacterized protein LOC133821721 [Humulus lupulus]